MASIQIPNLPVAVSLTGQELFECVQAGVSVRTTGLAVSLVRPGPVPVVINQTKVVLPANTSVPILSANPSRKYLYIFDIGIDTATCAPGPGPVTVGNGIPILAGNGSNFAMDGAVICQEQFSAVSALGTILIIWEGQ